MRFANDAAAQLCGFRDEAELRAATPSQILRRFELLDENGVHCTLNSCQRGAL